MKPLKDDIMGATLLRTLTYKSKLGFGKYPDLTVEGILKKKQIHYLIWLYYNCSMVSFTDEILIELGIFKRIRIEKPGKDKELYLKVADKIDKKGKPIKKKYPKKYFLSDKQHNIGNMRWKHDLKAWRQAKNQGH